MALPLLPIALVAGAAAAAWYLLKGDDNATPGAGVKGLPGAAANVPRPGDDPARTNMVMPDGSTVSTHPAVGLAMLQAVNTGDPNYIRNTAKQLRYFGWTTEAAQLEKVANSLGKPNSGTAMPGLALPQAAVPTMAPDLPEQYLAGMQAVINRGNPAEMRAYAAKLREAGYTIAADSLDRAAFITEQAIAAEAAGKKAAAAAAAAAAATASQGAASQSAESQEPIVLPEMVVTPKSPRREAADTLVRHLSETRKPNENQEIVKRYQALAGRSVDGKYGPGDAKSLAEDASGRHVPPAPRYWPKATYRQAKQEYDAWLTSKKYSDAARSDEWSAALASSGENYPS